MALQDDLTADTAANNGSAPWRQSGNGPKGIRNYALILLMPTLLFSTQLWTVFNSAPLWRQIADPGYQYLLNGVAIVSGVVPGHTDHPGTSTQWINGIVQFLTYQIAGQQTTFVSDVVARPEFYLNIDSLVVIFLGSAALVFASVRMLASLGPASTLVFQAIALPAAAIFRFTIYPIPESTVWICGLLVVGIMAPLAQNPRRPVHFAAAGAVGVVLALGATSKIIFLPLALLPLFWMRIRDLAVTAATGITTAVLILSPVRSQMQRMWEWFTATAKTSARYPEEERNSSGVSSLLGSPSSIIETFPFVALAVFFGIGFVIAIIMGVGPRKIWIQRLIGPIAVMLGLWAFTYKAWRANDLMLLGIAAGLLAALVFYSLSIDQAGPQYLQGRSIVLGIALLIIGLSAALFLVRTPQAVMTGSTPTAYDDQISYLESKRQSGTTVAAGYGVFSPASALLFANGTSNKVAAADIAEQYPGWINFSIWNSMFYVPTPDGSVLETCQTIETFVRSSKGLLLAPGRPVDVSQPTMQYGSITIAPEARFGNFDIFRVLDIQCP